MSSIICSFIVVLLSVDISKEVGDQEPTEYSDGFGPTLKPWTSRAIAGGVLDRLL